MKLWLDDQIHDPNTPDRHVPVGWYGCTTAKQAIEYISTGVVSEIDFDHDLGDEKCGTGYDVAAYIESRAYHQTLDPIKWNIHSANPIGRARIEAAMRSADIFWSKNKN